MADVFISYSRRDRKVVRRLHDALAARDRDSWVDWEDIPPTAEWLQEIFTAIEGTNAFLFVLSPDSATSAVCRQELAHAVAHHKRLIPVVCRDVASQDVPEAIAKHQWILLREPDNFEAGVEKLLDAVDTDLDWVKAHTRLLTKAIEWDGKGRDPSPLLRRSDLRDAEEWLAQSGGKEPKPTELQGAYILASSQGETRRKRQIMGGLLIGLVAVALFAAGAVYQYLEADVQRKEAERQFILSEERGRIALARQLAAQANLTFAQQGRHLTRSVLLAVESLKRHHSAEGLQALSRGLALLPRRVSRSALPVSEESWGIFSSNGRFLVTVNKDLDRRVWEVESGRKVMELPQVVTWPSPKGVLLAFSPGGRWLAVVLDTMTFSSRGRTVVIWDTATGQEAGRFLTREEVWALTWDHQGQRLALVWHDRETKTTTVTVLDAASMREVAGPLKPSHMQIFIRVPAMAFSPDGRWLATGGHGLAQVWDLASGRELRRLEHIFPVKYSDGQERQTNVFILAMVFSPDGRYLATSSEKREKGILVWEAATGRLIASLSHPGDCHTLAFSPDSRWLATASGTKVFPGAGGDAKIVFEQETGRATVKVWDAASGSEAYSLVHDDAVEQVTFSPDGKWLATCSYDGTARLWESATGREAARFLDQKGIEGLAFRDRSDQLVTVSRDNVVQVWVPPPPQEVFRLTHDGPVHRLAFSPDGHWLATGSIDRTARLWDTFTGREVARLGHPENVTHLAFSPDGGLLATGVYGFYHRQKTAAVTLWEVPGGGEVANLPHPMFITGLAFSPDGSQVATGGADGVARVWDTLTGKESFRLEPEPRKTPGIPQKERDEVRTVVFAPDGRWLAAGYLNYMTRLWDLASRREMAAWEAMVEGSWGTVTGVAFSHDGRWLAAGSVNKYAMAMETNSGKNVKALCHDLEVESLAFHPIKPWLVTGSRDRTARVWELPSGREVARVMHGGPVAKVAFSPDGRFVASAESCSGDRERDLRQLTIRAQYVASTTSGPGDPWENPACRALVRVWEAATGVEVGQFPHEKGIYDVAFSPDGRLLASASADGTVRVWRWQPEDLIQQACSRLTRNLTKAEWAQYVGDEVPYRKTCPDLPEPGD